MREKLRKMIEKSKLDRAKHEKDFLDIDIDLDTFSVEDYKKSLRVSRWKAFLNILSIPALILHELTHILFSLILFRRIDELYMSSPLEKDFHFVIVYKSAETMFLRHLIIGLSPILVPLVAIMLCFVSPYFLILLGYLLLNFKTAMPSKVDVFSVLLYKYMPKFEKDSDFSDFYSTCYNEFGLFELILMECFGVEKT